MTTALVGIAGFTTFSTFSIQIVLEVDAGEPGRAAWYLLASVVGGLAAATAGMRWAGSWHSRLCEPRHTRPRAPA
jgi:CrcB protein